ncbi:ferrochelatase [Staphylococcus sp. NAM3COL9]|uniref:ferrochelatase n=1 Tax=Staphylococcus sp. NAM3COL9 TaxID=1667172 RepID=UPI00264994DC|nr:ferrochelatase [Staphylococcus sp. NAM3COL9]
MYVHSAFTCEHLEVLYDNAYECKEICDDLRCNYYRAEMSGSNQLIIESIANAVINNYQEKNHLTAVT